MAGVFKVSDWVRIHPLAESGASQRYAGKLGQLVVEARFPGGVCTVRMKEDHTDRLMPEAALERVPTDEYGNPLAL